MTEAVEVATEYALLAAAQSFATAQSLTIAMPDIEFNPPAVSASAQYLRASFMPAPSIALGVAFADDNQHYGLFQLDVFAAQNGGELAPARIAALAIASFKRGTVLTKDGFSVRIVKAPYRGPMLKNDPWIMIPVSIPYVCFAPNPA